MVGRAQNLVFNEVWRADRYDLNKQGVVCFSKSQCNLEKLRIFIWAVGSLKDTKY